METGLPLFHNFDRVKLAGYGGLAMGTGLLCLPNIDIKSMSWLRDWPTPLPKYCLVKKLVMVTGLLRFPNIDKVK